MRAVVDGLADLEAGREHPQPGITLAGFRQGKGRFECDRLIVNLLFVLTKMGGGVDNHIAL